MTRQRRPAINPIFAELGRAVVAVMRDSSSTDPAEWERKAWLALALSAKSTRAAAYIDQPPVLIDPHSHSSHAMNPIDRRRYAAEGREPPPERHFFRCMFCGAFDFTSRAATPCPHGAP
jgi:hypothetical protein